MEHLNSIKAFLKGAEKASWYFFVASAFTTAAMKLYADYKGLQACYEALAVPFLAATIWSLFAWSASGFIFLCIGVYEDY